MIAQRKNSATKTDQGAVLEFLAALGYAKEDTPYFRSFFPNDDPRSASDKGRKSEKLDFNLVEHWQNEGRGVYLVVNGGGHKDEDVKSCRAIFCEHDRLSKAEQLVLWEKLGLPAPTIQIDTGGKSIHSYWVFQNLIPVEDWKELQADLLEFTDGDRVIKNPSRVMRLAGAWHISALGAVQTRIVTNSSKRYTFDELRNRIPPREKSSKHATSQIKFNSEDIWNKGNLDRPNKNWTRTDWALYYLKHLSPSRADDYQSWLHVGMILKAIDESLFHDWDNWSMQSSKYKPGQCANKWESFKSSGLNIGTLAQMAKEDGLVIGIHKPNDSCKDYQKEIDQNATKPSAPKNNVINFPIADIDLELLKKDIRSFLLTAPSKSSISFEIVKVRINNTRLSEREVIRLFETIEEEIEETESRVSRLHEVEELIKLSTTSVKLEEYIPVELANPVKMWCEWLNIRPEVVLTTVLATASSLHTVGTRLIMSHKRDFSVTPNMFAAIIAESGQKKSPIFRTFAKKPLRQLKTEVAEFYDQQYKDYEETREKWVADKTTAYENDEKFYEPEPKPPNKPAPFYFNHATGEGITAAAATNPEKTLFALVDELAGYFKSQDAYRQGKGSDKQEVLSYHDGEGKTVLRAGGIKADLDEVYLSIFGTIQPAVIKRLMGNADDDDGQWARFFFAHQPLAPSEMDIDDRSGVNLHERITAVYRNCFAVPKQEYTLSREALEIYVPFYNTLEHLRVEHPNSGMRALYSKAEGHTGVLALNLHIIRACTYGIKPPTEIAGETMQSAIALMKFYIGQSKLLYADMDTEVASHLAKLIATSKRYESVKKDGGWVSARTVRENIKMQDRKGKIGIREAEGWIDELVKMERGSKKYVGKTATKKGDLYFHYKVGMGEDPLDEFGELGDALGMDYPQPEPLTDKGSDTLGDFGDNFSFSQNFEESKSPPEDGGGSRLQVKVEKINNLRNRPQNPQASCDEGTASISLGETVSPNHPHDPQTPPKNVEEFVDKQIELSTTEVVPQVRDHDDAESTINIEFVTPVPKARVRVHCPGSNRDGRLGIVQCVRKARDPKGNILTNPDGSFVYEYVVKIEKCEDLAEKNLTYTCLVKQSKNSWLEVLSE